MRKTRSSPQPDDKHDRSAREQQAPLGRQFPAADDAQWVGPVSGLVFGSSAGIARRSDPTDPLGGSIVDRQIANTLTARRGRGRPLPEPIAQSIGDAMGVDLGDVRVHNDNEAATLARSLQATAFTQGSDVYFGAGAYVPHTEAGQHLLAHELAHTVQQAGSIGSQSPAIVGRAADPAETAADRVADSVLEVLRRNVGGRSAGPAVASRATGLSTDPIRRILAVQKKDYYGPQELPKILAIPKGLNASPTEAEQVRELLGAWASEPEEKKEGRTFATWALAAEAALLELRATTKKGDKDEVTLGPATTEQYFYSSKPLPEKETSPTLETEQDAAETEEFDVIETESLGPQGEIEPDTAMEEEADSAMEEGEMQTNDVNQTLYFTAEGRFCDAQGAPLSKATVTGLVDSIGWTHIYAGHGPGIPEETLRATAANKGVSGKWKSDAVVLAMAKLVISKIQSREVKPSPKFKVIDTPADLSVNYRAIVREKLIVGTVARRATQLKVGFKKQEVDGEERYVMKTIFPFPERTVANSDQDPTFLAVKNPKAKADNSKKKKKKPKNETPKSNAKGAAAKSKKKNPGKKKDD